MKKSILKRINISWLLAACSTNDMRIKQAFKALKISKELICDLLFYERVPGEFFIGELVQNEHFDRWTIGTTENHPSTDYLKKVECTNLDLKNGEAVILAHCLARSPLLEIRESFTLQFKFNTTVASWDIQSVKSVQHDYTLLSDITGTYVEMGRGTSKHVTISKNNEKLFIAGDFPHEENLFFDHTEIEINGLYAMWAMAYTADRSHAKGTKLSFAPDTGQLIFQGNSFDTRSYAFIKE